MFRLGACGVAVVFLLGGAGSAAAWQEPPPTPKAELQGYVSALVREHTRFNRLKRDTRTSMIDAYAFGSQTLDGQYADGPGPSIAAVGRLGLQLGRQSTGYELTAVRLRAIHAPRALRPAHATLIRAFVVASDELARRAELMNAIARDGSVNTGSIRDFDRVLRKLVVADGMAARWRVATAELAGLHGVALPASVEAFGTLSPLTSGTTGIQSSK